MKLKGWMGNKVQGESNAGHRNRFRLGVKSKIVDALGEGQVCAVCRRD
jgi:hypothetical protein